MQFHGGFTAGCVVVEAGLLSNLLQNVWPPVLKMPLRTDERKARFAEGTCASNLLMSRLGGSV